MTENEIVNFMTAATSQADWNRRCDEIKEIFGGYPECWHRAIIKSGISLQAVCLPEKSETVANEGAHVGEVQHAMQVSPKTVLVVDNEPRREPRRAFAPSALLMLGALGVQVLPAFEPRRRREERTPSPDTLREIVGEKCWQEPEEAKRQTDAAEAKKQRRLARNRRILENEQARQRARELEAREAKR